VAGLKAWGLIPEREKDTTMDELDRQERAAIIAAIDAIGTHGRIAREFIEQMIAEGSIDGGIFEEARAQIEDVKNPG
jgi:hypothetical protein